LELNEYIACLKSADLDLTDQEIITVGLCADVNADGRIDYEEFMKHFNEILKMMRTQSALHEAY